MVSQRRAAAICKVCGIEALDFERLHAHFASHCWKRFDSHQPAPSITEVPSTLAASVEVVSTTFTEASKDFAVEKPCTNISEAQYISKLFAKVDVDRHNSGATIYNIEDQQLAHIRLSIRLTCITEGLPKYCLICRAAIDESKVDIYEHYRSQEHCKYLQMMWEDHRAFESFPDGWSDLVLAQNHLSDVSDEFVFCHACQSGIPNETQSMALHITEKKHVEKHASIRAKGQELYKSVKTLITRDWCSVENYWCVPCQLTDPLEVVFTQHLRSERHKKNCAEFLQHGEKLGFDFCPTCATLFYGFSNTFIHHSACKLHKYHTKDRFFVVSKLPDACRKVLTAASNGVVQQSTSKPAPEVPGEQLVIADLESAVKNIFPTVKAHPFGSRVTTFSNESSDLDIFVDCGEAYNSTAPLSITLNYLVAVLQYLTDENHIWSILMTVVNCRVPIIRVYHRPTGLECDLTFSDGIAVENSKLLRQYADNYPICRRVILFLKKWMQSCDFAKTNKISSYALAWLAIYYLQQCKIVPTVAEVIVQGESIRIGNWENAVMVKTEPSSVSYDLIDLFRGFFAFYGHFDYQREVICPLLGATVEKLTFLKPRELPTAMQRYSDYIKSTGKPTYFRIDKPLCIQDPIKLSDNLSVGVNKATLHRFKKYCTFSAELL